MEKKAATSSGTSVPYPVYPTVPQKKGSNFMRKRQQCQVPKRRFTVNLQGLGRKHAAIFGKKAATSSGTSVPYPVYPPDRTPKKQLLRKRQQCRGPKRRFTVNLQGLGRKKKAATCGKKAATFAGTSYCRARTRCTACCISVPCLLYQRRRTCSTTVPYLLYQRTVPVVPPYRTRCTPRPYPKKSSNFWKKAAFFWGTVGWYDWYGQLVRLVRSAGTTGTVCWYDWYA